MISTGETSNEIKSDVKKPEHHVYYVRNEPVMQAALDVFTTLNKYGEIVLLARGNSIPAAVAIANIIVDKMLHRSCTIKHILLDSESEYGKRMISTIEIMIAKN